MSERQAALGARPGHPRDVKPGSIWRSRDRRDNGRTVTVETVGTQVHGAEHVGVRSVRRSTLRVQTLLERYDLLTAAPDA